MRISDWSSDVCSSDLILARGTAIAEGSMARTSAWGFLVGLPLGAMAIRLGTDWEPAVFASWPVLVAAGLLVGFGTRLGSGCTSGHGVCGVRRLSQRSMVATAAFIAAGIDPVFIMSLVGVCRVTPSQILYPILFLVSFLDGLLCVGF